MEADKEEKPERGGERIDWLSSVEEAQHINYSHVQ